MPGKPHVGIEVPNPRRETIYLREVIESRPFRESSSKADDRAGQDNRRPELRRRPGKDASPLDCGGPPAAGKSVGVNSLIVSILYRAAS